MAQGTLWLQPIQHIFSATGVNVAGAKAYYYLAGSSTPVAVYTDVGLVTPHQVPVVADGNGIFAEIFLTPGTAYKVDLQTSAGVSLPGYPADNQLAIPASSSVVAFTGTAGEALLAVAVAYLSDGSGGKTAGQWYNADSLNTYSSILPEIGIAAAAIASGSTGTIQQAGRLTGFSGLTIGADYYVGTAGALTSTAPTINARFIGRADSASSLILSADPPPPVSVQPIGTCEGRLTLTTLTPVTTSDVTAATSLYFTPYRGNRIALFDGTATWNLRSFSEITISLVGLTASKPYDIFAYDNAGVVTCETLVWTNATTRATAVVLQNGVLVKSGATTRRLIGTIYINASGGQTDDAEAARSVANYYNALPRPLRKAAADATWPYTTATWRQANANAANQVSWVTCYNEYPIPLTAVACARNGATLTEIGVGIGVDSTTTPNSHTIGGAADTSVIDGFIALQTAFNGAAVGVGYHVAALLEFSEAISTTVWLGSSGGLITGSVPGGIQGHMYG